MFQIFSSTIIWPVSEAMMLSTCIILFCITGNYLVSQDLFFLLKNKMVIGFLLSQQCFPQCVIHAYNVQLKY